MCVRQAYKKPSDGPGIKTGGPDYADFACDKKEAVRCWGGSAEDAWTQPFTDFFRQNMFALTQPFTDCDKVDSTAG